MRGKKRPFLRCPTGLTHPTTGLLIDGRGYYETLDPPLGTPGKAKLRDPPQADPLELGPG